ncbi:MAG: flagellar motor switch protein FliG [Acidobacteriaceae bacterium]
MASPSQDMTASVAVHGEGAHLLPVPADMHTANIPGIRKAAILMISLGDELAKTLVQSLTEMDVQRLTEEIASIKQVPPDLILQVMHEFYTLLETQQFMLRGGIDYATKLLVDSFGQKRAEGMLHQVKQAQEATHGDLAMLQKMDPVQVSKFLEGEHPQTVALVLAHLDPKKASIALMSLGEAQRVAAVHRLAEMRQFSPEMAQKVALSLYRKMETVAGNGRKSYSGYKGVADLLNRLDLASSKTILEEIEKKEPKVAIGIRDLMFTFEDLVTVPTASIREFVSATDKRVLALALKGAKEDVKAHLFTAMSSRAVEMLREDMEAMGPVRGRDVSAAQQELLALARKLESEGKIILKAEADDDFTI